NPDTSLEAFLDVLWFNTVFIKNLMVTDGATVPEENLNYPIWVSNDAHVHMPIISTISEASFRHVQEYADVLAAIGEPIKDKDLVMLVVSGLREEYNGLKTTITSRQSPTAFSELHALLSDHDYILGKLVHLLRLSLHRLLQTTQWAHQEC
nr:ribonuclease H-like domain-containing protein [Tanacetum cinerariifolium]